MVLSIPDKCRRQKKKEYVIPEFISQYKNLKIIKTDYDYGPSMKLLPVLEYEREPESIIITIDDDHVYNEEFLETILKYSKQYPDCAVGFDGWNVRSLIEKNKFEFFYENLDEPVSADVLAGFRGVLYKKKFFTDDIFDYEGFPKIAFMQDDVWISAHLAKNNIKRLILPGFHSKEILMPHGLHRRLTFKRICRRMAIEFDRRGYWKRDSLDGKK